MQITSSSRATNVSVSLSMVMFQLLSFSMRLTTFQLLPLPSTQPSAVRNLTWDSSEAMPPSIRLSATLFTQASGRLLCLAILRERVTSSMEVTMVRHHLRPPRSMQLPSTTRHQPLSAVPVTTLPVATLLLLLQMCLRANSFSSVMYQVTPNPSHLTLLLS